MPLTREAISLPLAHANIAIDVRPRARAHLTLNFADRGALPFVARGVDLWHEPGSGLTLVGIGARLPGRVEAALRAEVGPRMLRIIAESSRALVVDFENALRSSALPYEPLGLHGSPAPLGPFGGVGLRFRSPGAGEGSFSLEHGGAFRLVPRLEPSLGNDRNPQEPPHPATVDAHARWSDRWGVEAMEIVSERVGPLARRLLGDFRSLLLAELPQQITVPEERH